MENERVITLALQYLAQQLTEEEKQNFEQQYQDDQEFARQVDQCLRLEYATRTAGKAQLYNTFNKEFDQWKSEQTKRRWRYVGVAALPIFALIIGLYMLLRGVATMPELYEQYYTPRELSSTMSDTQSQWESFVEVYNQKDYKQAEELLLALSQDSSFTQTSRLYLYLGNCQLGQNKPQEAITSFQKVSKDSAYAEEAQWYTALTYLKAEDKPNAVRMFTQIKDEQGYYAPQAQKILSQLK